MILSSYARNDFRRIGLRYCWQERRQLPVCVGNRVHFWSGLFGQPITREERIQRFTEKANAINAVYDMPGVMVKTTTPRRLLPLRTPTRKNVPSGLAPIPIKDLDLDQVHVGRVLFGTVVAPCARMASAQTLVQDANGDLAELSIYNIRGDPDHFFFLGQEIAIIDPFFKLRIDGTEGIRVDDPTKVVIACKDPTVNQA